MVLSERGVVSLSGWSHCQGGLCQGGLSVRVVSCQGGLTVGVVSCQGGLSAKCQCSVIIIYHVC